MRTSAAGQLGTSRFQPIERHGPVPYLSQLDGSPTQYENCGPTVMAMAARAYGRLPGLTDSQLIHRLRGFRDGASSPGGGTPPRGMSNIGAHVNLRAVLTPDNSDARLTRQLNRGALVALAGDFDALPWHENPRATDGH